MSSGPGQREHGDDRRKGAIVLVVGPSGAGKDSVIAFARRALDGDPRFVFARRLITRAVDGTEDHEACTDADFENLEAADALALSWRAHGTAYGIRNTVRHEIDAGRVVVANVSRRVVPAGILLAPRALVAHVTASPAVLADRLRQRGRETADEIAGRLAREAPLPQVAGRILTLNNDGPIEIAGSALLHALRELAAASPERRACDDAEPGV